MERQFSRTVGGDSIEWWAYELDKLGGRRGVARMFVKTPSGIISGLNVPEPERRRGHARALYEHVRDVMRAEGGELFHAPHPWRTDDGRRFIEAVGGPVADYETADKVLPPVETHEVKPAEVAPREAPPRG